MNVNVDVLMNMLKKEEMKFTQHGEVLEFDTENGQLEVIPDGAVYLIQTPSVNDVAYDEMEALSIIRKWVK